VRRKIGARRRASNAKDARWANATIPARLAKKKRPQWDSNHPLQVYDCARGIVEKRPDSCRVTSMLVYGAQHYIYLVRRRARRRMRYARAKCESWRQSEQRGYCRFSVISNRMLIVIFLCNIREHEYSSEQCS